MNSGNSTKIYPALHCRQANCEATELELIGEEPLVIRIDGKPYSVVMRTPGEELFHAAGFCLGEGIADSPDDFMAVGYCDDMDANVIDIRLSDARRAKVSDLLARRGFVSQTSCGICGKEMIADLQQILTPAADGFTVELERVFDCIAKLSDRQRYYQRTRGSHAAILFDERLEVLAFAEDVGRHNALDKALGKAFMQGRLKSAGLLVLSSRISYELVQKAARARVPVMISNSRPTALAVEMGRALNLTLAFPAGKDDLIVVCGADRIVGKSDGKNFT